MSMIAAAQLFNRLAGDNASRKFIRARRELRRAEEQSRQLDFFSAWQPQVFRSNRETKQ